jgi:transposase
MPPRPPNGVPAVEGPKYGTGVPAVKGPRYGTGGLSLRTRLNIHRLLQLGWSVPSIAQREHCCERTVYRLQSTILTHGTLRPPLQGTSAGRPRKITEEDGDALFSEMLRSGWLYQDEMVHWLMEKRGVVVSQPTMHRYIKKRGWTKRSHKWGEGNHTLSASDGAITDCNFEYNK